MHYDESVLKIRDHFKNLTEFELLCLGLNVRDLDEISLDDLFSKFFSFYFDTKILSNLIDNDFKSTDGVKKRLPSTPSVQIKIIKEYSERKKIIDNVLSNRAVEEKFAEYLKLLLDEKNENRKPR